MPKSESITMNLIVFVGPYLKYFELNKNNIYLFILARKFAS